MEHTYADYLFILAIYSEGVTLDKLLFHIEPGGAAAAGTRAQVLATLEEMEARGLVALGRRQDGVHIRLTALGVTVSDKLAGAMAEDMVNDWRGRQLEFAPPDGRAAGF